MKVTIQTEPKDILEPSAYLEMEPLEFNCAIGKMQVDIKLRMPPKMCKDHYMETAVENVKNLTSQVSDALIAILSSPDLSETIIQSIK
jgi:hypothetical protein